MTDPQSNPHAPTAAEQRQGRVVRFLLLALPIGTVILGAVSFVFYFAKKNRVEERTYSYAAALRKDLSVAEWRKHAAVFTDMAGLPPMERLGTIGVYLQSAVGPENMGYDPRVLNALVGGEDIASVEVEVTGARRPQDIVLVAAGYGTELKSYAQETAALASWLGMAHSLTGEKQQRSIRFVALPERPEKAPGEDLVKRFADACRQRGERVTHLFLLRPRGDVFSAHLQVALDTATAGTVVEFTPVPDAAEAALPVLQQLRQRIIQAAERF